MLDGTLDFGTQLLEDEQLPERRDQPEPERRDQPERPERQSARVISVNPFNDQVLLWELESSAEPGQPQRGDVQPEPVTSSRSSLAMDSLVTSSSSSSSSVVMDRPERGQRDEPETQPEPGDDLLELLEMQPERGDEQPELGDEQPDRGDEQPDPDPEHVSSSSQHQVAEELERGDERPEKQRRLLLETGGCQ